MAMRLYFILKHFDGSKCCLLMTHSCFSGDLGYFWPYYLKPLRICFIFSGLSLAANPSFVQVGSR